MPDRPRARWPHVALGSWAALVLALLVWPLYDRLGNRVEPRVFGLPLAFAWNALLAGATFLVLAGYFALTEPSGGPKGRDPGSEDQGPGGGEA